MFLRALDARFNSQPPEGGWLSLNRYLHSNSRFNSQPPEGGWDKHNAEDVDSDMVSTHSRPKAAGHKQRMVELRHRVSTHSRPKAAGYVDGEFMAYQTAFQLTAARRRLVEMIANKIARILFQLTAARRRLAASQVQVNRIARFNSQPPEGGWVWDLFGKSYVCGFNSQPPEGGWGFQ